MVGSPSADVVLDGDGNPCQGRARWRPGGSRPGVGRRLREAQEGVDGTTSTLLVSGAIECQLQELPPHLGSLAGELMRRAQRAERIGHSSPCPARSPKTRHRGTTKKPFRQSGAMPDRGPLRESGATASGRRRGSSPRSPGAGSAGRCRASADACRASIRAKSPRTTPNSAARRPISASGNSRPARSARCRSSSGSTRPASSFRRRPGLTATPALDAGRREPPAASSPHPRRSRCEPWRPCRHRSA